MKSKMSKIAKIRMKREKSIGAPAGQKIDPTVMLPNISDDLKVTSDIKVDMTDIECHERKEDLIAKKIKKKKEAWHVSDNKVEGKSGVAKEAIKGEATKKESSKGDKSECSLVSKEKHGQKNNKSTIQRARKKQYWPRN